MSDISIFTTTGQVEANGSLSTRESEPTSNNVLKGMPKGEYIDLKNNSEAVIPSPEARVFPFVTIDTASRLLEQYSDFVSNSKGSTQKYWAECIADLDSSLNKLEEDAQYISIQRGKVLASPSDLPIFTIATSFPMPDKDGLFHVMQAVNGIRDYNSESAKEMHKIAKEGVAKLTDIDGVVFDGISLYADGTNVPGFAKMGEFIPLIKSIKSAGGDMYITGGNRVQKLLGVLFREQSPLYLPNDVVSVSQTVDYILNKRRVE